MNFPLAREIYGTNPFLIDAQTLPSMMSILDDFRNGVKYESNEKELKNSSFKIATLSETKLIQKPYQLDNNDDFEGIGVVNINGPILVNGGASTMGMNQVSQMMYDMAKDKRIKSFIMLFDSGGGSSSAVEIMNDCISDIRNQGKDVYALVVKGGSLGSAAYGIASACNKIYYESDMSIVGSLGTMMQMSGRPANSENDGVKYIRLYATKSTMKNKQIEEALNNDNYELIISELLDPINENFLQLLKTNRPQLSDDYLNGSIKFAKDSIGTFTDGKMSFNELVNKVMLPKQINMNINQNRVDMTRAELQQSHPDLYNEIYNEGVTTERERVQSWLAHVETDQATVIEGIESGNDITPSKREKLLVKQNKLNQLKNSEAENADDFTTPESSMGAGKPENNELKELESSLSKLTLKNQ